MRVVLARDPGGVGEASDHGARAPPALLGSVVRGLPEDELRATAQQLGHEDALLRGQRAQAACRVVGALRLDVDQRP